MLPLRFRFLGGILAACLACPAPLTAAFIDPANVTGTFGIDPSNFNGSLPAGMNTNTIATVRTTPTWVRGSANTTYQGWDLFNSLSSPNNANDPAVTVNVLGNDLTPRVDSALFNPGTSTVTAAGGGIITGGGNLYNPTGTISFTTSVPNYSLGSGYKTHFLIQLRAATGDFDPASFSLNGTLVSTLPNFSYQLLNQQAYSVGQGPTVAFDYKLEFSSPGNNAADSLAFSALGSGLSFDKFSIDTSITAVPEPSMFLSLGLIACIGLGILWHRRVLR